jgi:hypothetical protein
MKKKTTEQKNGTRKLTLDKISISRLQSSGTKNLNAGEAASGSTYDETDCTGRGSLLCTWFFCNGYLIKWH